ncbi:MAG: hypothetical protein JXD23_15405 [Spirochaetales bacterium]|nr:hypothetical protein [Spirochaetales bacterium]
MDETTNNPLDELKHINNAIKKYEIVLKTTKDSYQKQRVRKELAKLKDYREKFEHVYSILDDESDDIDSSEFDGFPFLSQHLNLDEETAVHDREVNGILSILSFFGHEFLTVMTEKKMKLDFKFALERDGFYHLYQDLMKRIHDFEDEIKVINEGKYTDTALTDIKNRRLRKRRVLIIETDKLFRRCLHFTGEILKDIEKSGVACRNPDEILRFDELEGLHFLEGRTVHEALSVLDEFAGEVLSYFNLPEIVVQEQ